MRRPGTLPPANTHPATTLGLTSQQQRTGATGLFCTSPQSNEITSNGSASLRITNSTSNNNNNNNTNHHHHSSHSLRRNHQSSPAAPALPARGDSCNSERLQQNNSRISNGMIPSHPPPPPRHSPPCPQSSYPTLPINGHVVTSSHHYRHYRSEQRDRSRERSASRDREINNVTGHRNESKQHRVGDTLELEVHEDDSSSGIGTYRA